MKSGNTFSNENYGLTATTKIIETIPNDEFEPNNSFSTATSISLDSNTKGRLSSKDDDDYFKFTTTKDGSISLRFDHLLTLY